MTREEWLDQCAEKMRPMFDEARETLHTPALPEQLHVSCGWPSQKATARKSRAIGQCFQTACSAAHLNEVFVSPAISDALTVSATLLHELIHAADNCQHGHRQAVFGQLARHFGLEGKLTATHAGPELTERLNAICAELGEYPHQTLDVTIGAKKQSTRLIKLECPSCGYTIRTTQKWLDQYEDLPLCPCGERFERG
jgi:hypothetical protein